MIILVPRAFSLPRPPRKECMRNFWNGLKMCKNVLKLFLKLNLLVWSCVSVEFRGDFVECSGQPVVWVPRRLNWRNDLKLIWKLCCHVKDAKCKLSLIQSRFCMTTVDLVFAIYSSGQHTGPSWSESPAFKSQASFWLPGLSVHLCIAMQIISKFIWVNPWLSQKQSLRTSPLVLKWYCPWWHIICAYYRYTTFSKVTIWTPAKISGA